jgi:hypothetical protein
VGEVMPLLLACAAEACAGAVGWAAVGLPHLGAFATRAAGLDLAGGMRWCGAVLADGPANVCSRRLWCQCRVRAWWRHLGCGQFIALSRVARCRTAAPGPVSVAACLVAACAQ